jgi:hypothetical protein
MWSDNTGLSWQGTMLVFEHDVALWDVALEDVSLEACYWTTQLLRLSNVV